jgi:hypothetical protein
MRSFGFQRKAWSAPLMWEERIKNFRSIRRGIMAVVDEIQADTFGNAYRGSSLETVVHSIAEQPDEVAHPGLVHVRHRTAFSSPRKP